MFAEEHALRAHLLAALKNVENLIKAAMRVKVATAQPAVHRPASQLGQTLQRGRLDELRAKAIYEPVFRKR